MDDKGQMFLLTGVLVILLSVVAASMSSELANVNVERSIKINNRMLNDFKNVKEAFVTSLEKKDTGITQEKFEETLNETRLIKAKYGISIQGKIIQVPLEARYEITLTLENDDTMISQTFDFSPS